MPAQWMLALEIPLLTLVIPVAILAGHRVRSGPILITSGGALLAFIVFWASGLRGAFSPGNSFNYDAFIYVYIYVFFGGVILLLSAWALALADTMSERRWGWAALLSLAVYLTFAALFAILLSPYSSCMFAAQQPYCVSATASVWGAFVGGSFIGPVAVLLYALPPYIPRRRGALPAGLRVSRLSSAQDTEPDTEPDPR